MRKAQVVVCGLIVIILFVVWTYYDFKCDPSPIYIPGRDTVKEWNDGECEIGRTASFYVVELNKQDLTSEGNRVLAYREIGTDVYFITEKGGIVVDLTAKTYKRYADKGQSEVFADPDSFTWLDKIE